MKKKEIKKKFKNQMKPAFKASENAEPITFKNRLGKEHCQCPGTYNDYMNRAIASDLLFYGATGPKEYADKNENIIKFATKFRNFNFDTLRMIDDMKGNRDIKCLDNENLVSAIESLKNIASDKAYIEAHTMSEDFAYCIKLAMMQLLYMQTWAFYIIQLDDMKIQEMKVQTKIYDANNENMLNGLSESDETLVIYIIKLRRILLHVLLRLNTLNKEYDLVFDKLATLELITKAILEGKMDDLCKLVNTKN